MRKITLNLLTLFILVGGFFLYSQNALAADNYGLDKTAKEAGIPMKNTDVAVLAGQTIGVVLSFLAVIFLALMIYAGFIWMLARGNESEVTTAKNIIKAAIAGLIIVVASYAIVKFVFTFLLSS